MKGKVDEEQKINKKDGQKEGTKTGSGAKVD